MGFARSQVEAGQVSSLVLLRMLRVTVAAGRGCGEGRDGWLGGGSRGLGGEGEGSEAEEREGNAAAIWVDHEFGGHHDAQSKHLILVQRETLWTSTNSIIT